VEGSKRMAKLSRRELERRKKSRVASTRFF